MYDKRKKFEEIYDKYIERIYRFIYLKVNSQEIAQDICSETFLRGWQTFQSKEIENPQAFLYQIARNLVIDFYRKREKTETVPIESCPEVSNPINIEEEAMLMSDINNIKRALTNIKEEYQDVIIWYYLDDLPIPEVAKMLNKSEETTRVTLHRALKALKEACNKRESFSS